jgi:hypothetical protein
MDKRLLKMRQLAWKLESAHSMAEAGQERQGNREARDEWAMQLNTNLAFIQSNFGEQAKETLQQDITGGFGKIHRASAFLTWPCRNGTSRGSRTKSFSEHIGRV